MMMTEAYEESVYREGYRRGKAERHRMLDDGTLVVSVDDATAVTRVLVEDEHKNGDLYYADRPKGEWKPFDLTWGRNIWYCTACEESVEVPCDIWTHKPIYNFCPYCGADMRPKGDDDV